jgi:isoleucyl-tRNA synthetase
MVKGGITREELERIPENINFPQEEEKILQFWKDTQAFETCLKQSKNKPRYELKMPALHRLL